MRACLDELAIGMSLQDFSLIALSKVGRLTVSGTVPWVWIPGCLKSRGREQSPKHACVLSALHCGRDQLLQLPALVFL